MFVLILRFFLQPENIFLDCKDRVKIGDFGLAIHLQPLATGTASHADYSSELTKYCGTSFYIAPELNSK